MFEENKNNIEDLDFGFRSMMEEAQEPVPAHVWDRIEADLDKIARKRVAVLWFRRAAVGAAAAAALAFGLFFGHDVTEDIVTPGPGSDAIAVIGSQDQTAPADTSSAMETAGIPALLAMADIKETSVHRTDAPAEAVQTEAQTAEASDDETVPGKAAPDKNVPGKNDPARTTTEKQGNTSAERFPDIWEDDEPRRKRTATSLVVSGLTGTNGAQNNMRLNPMKRPGISAAPKKTGIKETSTNTTYGIPVSAGLGVRFDFTPRWSLGVGINYTLLTRKFYGTYTQIGTDGGILKDVSSDIRNSQHYLGIPVNAYYNIVNQERINFYAYAGGTAEKCLTDRYQVLSTDITHTEKAKGIQFSANIGLGVEFMLGRHLGLYIDPSVRYYFDCGQPKSIRTAQPLMLGFEMGFRARL